MGQTVPRFDVGDGVIEIGGGVVELAHDAVDALCKVLIIY